MPINKYINTLKKDMDKMRSISMDLDIFGTSKLKGVSLHGSIGMVGFPEIRGAHHTLAMAMALDTIKQSHKDAPIFHMPHEPIMWDYDDMDERVRILTNQIHTPQYEMKSMTNYPSIGEIINDRIEKFKPYKSLTIDSFTHDDEYDIGNVDLFGFWNNLSTSVCRYDEERVKAYKIPSKDRLDMLSRIYKLIKGKEK